MTATGRDARAADFAARLAEAAKRKGERVETRTELTLPPALADALADLQQQALAAKAEAMASREEIARLRAVLHQLGAVFEEGARKAS
jgi:hypothetical protein